MEYDKYLRDQLYANIHKFEKLLKIMLDEIIVTNGQELFVNHSANVKRLADIFKDIKETIANFKEGLKLYDEMQERKTKPDPFKHLRRDNPYL